MKERASAPENSATGSGGIVQTSPQMLVSSLGGGLRLRASYRTAAADLMRQRRA